MLHRLCYSLPGALHVIARFGVRERIKIQVRVDCVFIRRSISFILEDKNPFEPKRKTVKKAVSGCRR